MQQQLLMLKMMALKRLYPLITPLKPSLSASCAVFYCSCARLLQPRPRSAGRDWHTRQHVSHVIVATTEVKKKTHFQWTCLAFGDAALFIHELARNFSIWFKPHVTLFSH